MVQRWPLAIPESATLFLTDLWPNILVAQPVSVKYIAHESEIAKICTDADFRVRDDLGRSLYKKMYYFEQSNVTPHSEGLTLACFWIFLREKMTK